MSGAKAYVERSCARLFAELREVWWMQIWVAG